MAYNLTTSLQLTAGHAKKRVENKKSPRLFKLWNGKQYDLRPLKNCKDSRFYDFGIFSKKL